MAYGITSSSQLIDLDSIKAGCENYKDALDDFTKCGELVIYAGTTCSSKALSVDDSTLEYPINELGEEIKKLKTTYSSYADDVVAQATKIYNAQVSELNEYIRKQQELEAQQQNSNNS
jgi:hypothetical protein